ncbi:hypothetical protein TNCV_4893641 [Trichonephila clavipes]|nr:hypothetical protein TNCV_4893641 [Trichonephila clavipes]
MSISSPLPSRSVILSTSAPKNDHFKLQGRSATHTSSPLIGRDPKVCSRHSDLLVSYSCGTHYNTLWTVWNVLVPDFSSDIRTLVHHTVIVFLKSFSCHLPRRQCSQLDRLRQWSPFGAFPCSPRHPVRVSSVAKQQAATPKQRVLSPSHLL